MAQSGVLIGIIIFLLFLIFVLYETVLYYYGLYNTATIDCTKCSNDCTNCYNDCSKCETPTTTFKIYSGSLVYNRSLLTQGDSSKPTTPDITVSSVYVYSDLKNDAQLWNLIPQANNGNYIQNVASKQYLTPVTKSFATIRIFVLYELTLTTTPTVFYLNTSFSKNNCNGITITTLIDNTKVFLDVTTVGFPQQNLIQYRSVILVFNPSTTEPNELFYLIPQF